MSAKSLSYQYVVLRCVPRVDREEFLNVGVVLYCEETAFLEAAWRVDRERLAALDPGLDLDAVCDGLAFVEGVCRGDESVGAAAGKPAVAATSSRKLCGSATVSLASANMYCV